MNKIRNGIHLHLKSKDRRRAQAAVEFALILPIALLLIFVTIEIARMAQAWLVVTNSARVGLRYAVTGAYEAEYCTGAIDSNGNGFVCEQEDDDEARKEEIDQARLLSIYDLTERSAVGIMKDLTITDKDTPGYFHVTVCSTNSEEDEDGNEIVRVYHPPPDDYCSPFDHPGDPSTGPARVLVAVTFEHPIILPIVNSIAPSVTLHAKRTGIVEQFRVARVLGLPPVISVPTATPAPPTDTPVPGTATPTLSPTPVDCSLYTMTLFDITDGNNPRVYINNNSSVDVNVTEFELTWDTAYNWGAYYGIDDLTMVRFVWNGFGLTRLDSVSSPSFTGANSLLQAGISVLWESRFAMSDEVGGEFNTLFGLTPENFGYRVLLDNGCEIEHLEVPLAVPEPNCDLYQIGEFNISGDEFSIGISNGDEYGALVEQIIFDWDYAQAYDALVDAQDPFAIDYFSYDGLYIWGGGSGSPYDFESPTDTNTDYPETWTNAPFEAGGSYTLRGDFDNQWDTFNADILPSDFGIQFIFTNGCTLEVAATPRDLPEPNCDLYEATGFTMIDQYNRIEAFLTNNDLYSTEIDSIVLNWHYADQISDYIIGSNNLYVDWMIWDGSYIWSNNNDGIGDLSSPTNTAVDSPGAWYGPDDFYANDTVNYRVDFDFLLGGEYDGALSSWGVIPSDFGATFNFTNGCELEIPVEPRAVATPTPSCDNIFADWVRIRDDDFEIRIQNNNTAPAYLIESFLTWPGPVSPPASTAGQPYVNYFQHGSIYYGIDTYTSPVLVDVGTPGSSLPSELAPVTGVTWRADFNNGMPYGEYCGQLTYEYLDWGTCVINECADIATPVPSATPDPNATPTPTRTDRPTSTYTPLPSNTPLPTNTPPPTNTPLPTNTPRPSATPRPTYTPGPPTNTYTPSPTVEYEPPTNTPWPTLPGGG